MKGFRAATSLSPFLDLSYAIRLEGWHIRRDLPGASISLSLLPAYVGHAVGLLPSLVISPPYSRMSRTASGRLGVDLHRHGGWVVLHPRGPRSSSGYSVPNRHHLIGPIRPTRRHIAISPHGGLYAMPSLCGSA